MKNSDNSATRKLHGSGSHPSKVTKVWKLDSPAHCRNAFEEIEVKGKGKITFVTLESGKELQVKDMTDSEVVFYANEIF